MNNLYALKYFEENGFSIIKPFKKTNFLDIYTKEWIRSILGEVASKEPSKLHLGVTNLEEYSKNLSQKKRHRSEEELINKIINVYKLNEFLYKNWSKTWSIWDEGFGSLGIRIVRPKSNDGYLWSCKAWGPAKNVISASILIYSECNLATTSIIPYSHKLDTLPTISEKSIHCKDELRLDTKKFKTTNRINPLNDNFEMLLTHPKLIHTEKNFSDTSTRVSLEFRLQK
tara:strand:+ start:1038 stop:1721 length:684 start_codon:yes stop_codon:yes gene_type:complete